LKNLGVNVKATSRAQIMEDDCDCDMAGPDSVFITSSNDLISDDLISDNFNSDDLISDDLISDDLFMTVTWRPRQCLCLYAPP
jgi:hypothetical protein